jgi:hypothetical protein
VIAHAPNADIVTAIRVLPARHRLTVYLAGIRGLGYRQISDLTGMPIGTVKSSLHRGRTRLRAPLLTTTRKPAGQPEDTANPGHPPAAPLPAADRPAHRRPISATPGIPVSSIAPNCGYCLGKLRRDPTIAAPTHPGTAAPGELPGAGSRAVKTISRDRTHKCPRTVGTPRPIKHPGRVGLEPTAGGL